MYHVLLVSDNRLLLKQLYEYLEKDPQFEILIVPFSTNTYERFVGSKSDLVVFDSANMIPYKKILEQLTQSQWNYHVILLSDRAETLDDNSHVIVLEKHNLNAQTLISTLIKAAQTHEYGQPEEILVSLNWNGQIEFVPYPDAYYILLAKFIGTNKEAISSLEIQKFKASTLHAGEVEIISIMGRDLILSMRKTKMRSGFEFSGLAKIVKAVFGNDYAIFFHENISWTRLNQAYEQLTAASDYGYFLMGESLDISELNKHIIKLVQKDVHDILWRILQAALLGKREDSRILLKTLFLHQLKSSLDLYMRGYIRHNLLMICKILSGAAKADFNKLNNHYFSIEDEYMDWDKVIKAFCERIKVGQPINPIAINAITKIYRGYFEDISLESISQELNVNKIYLGRLFREQLGMTALDLLQEIRYENACYMLKFSSIKIGIISKAVGYNDPGYFSRIFKNRAGLAPEDYRSAAQNRENGEYDV
jgi:AraC-like DNA-binding protein